MEAIIFCGIQASGKTTFYLQRFFHTHVRISLDQLRTRHRERLLISALLEAKQPFVVDNTNPTRAERALYIDAAMKARFTVTGYYFRADIEACKSRNESRDAAQAVPLRGLLGTYKRLEFPRHDEGFGKLYYVKSNECGGFVVEEWQDEI